MTGSHEVTGSNPVSSTKILGGGLDGPPSEPPPKLARAKPALELTSIVPVVSLKEGPSAIQDAPPIVAAGRG